MVISLIDADGAIMNGKEPVKDRTGRPCSRIAAIETSPTGDVVVGTIKVVERSSAALRGQQGSAAPAVGTTLTRAASGTEIVLGVSAAGQRRTRHTRPG